MTMETLPALEERNHALRSPVFSDLDRRFAAFISQHDEGNSELLQLAAALVSYQLNRGHIFLDLAVPPAWDDVAEAPLLSWPDASSWVRDLRKSPVVGRPGENRPLIASDSGRLYLQRYWAYEHLLAQKLKERAAASDGRLPDKIERELDRLFPDADEQKEAGRNAFRRHFSLISGGPGTGKTTTVLKILMLLLEANPEMTVSLAAPTGKAAARLQESVRDGLAQLPCPENVREKIGGLEASTIHRLLGPVPGSVFFRHNESNPLAADIVVLDEASMVDLPLMAKLIAALSPACRLLLLGDKDQLASVEAGSVLSGMVEAAVAAPPGGSAPPLAGVATVLTKNYRFGNDSAIFRVCNAVRDGNPGAAFEVLREEDDDVTWQELPAPGGLKEQLRPRVVAGFRAFLQEKNPAAALDAFGRFQVLTVLRQGPFGKENLNFLIEDILREEGLILPGRRHYPGRPLMVTENDYSVRLFNGDIGVLLEDEEGKLMSFFRSEDGTIRKISPLRLPFAEPAFAMTVHKSQGSEFDEVLLLLPARDTRILTRELIYTAISRARRKVEIWTTEEIFSAAVSRKVTRASGLAEMLV